MVFGYDRGMPTEQDEVYAFFGGTTGDACPECGAVVEWRRNYPSGLAHLRWHKNLKAALDALKQYVVTTTELLGVIVDE